MKPKSTPKIGAALRARKLTISAGLALATCYMPVVVRAGSPVGLYGYFQQTEVRVSGVVTDAKGNPIQSVTVAVNGSSRATITDSTGNFVLMAPQGSNLLFSGVGLKRKEMKVPVGGMLMVRLDQSSDELEEVVAVGYQRLRKSDVTGAISSVKAKELNTSAPTVGQSLIGKVAGVQISQVSGAPYEGAKVRVRGIGSINASSDPLYVIDGYPAASNDVFINPNDIESIEILKDAASAAIYGSRASGGVVLITTKRGKEGKGKFEYDFQGGLNQLSKKVDLLNSDQFVDLLIDARNGTYRDLMVNSGRAWSDDMYSHSNATRVANVGNAGSVSIPEEFYDFATQKMIRPKYNTDWQDELYRNAMMQRHTLSFSGGNKSARYFLSGGYQDQEGIIKSTGQKRINLRANIDGEVSRRLKMGANIALTTTQNREVLEGRFHQGPILGALIYAPIFRAYNDDGSLAKNESASKQALYGYQTIENPVALATETKISRNGIRGSYNGYASLELLKGLVFKANLGVQTYNEKYEYYIPTSLSSGNNPPGSPQAQAAARANAQSYSLVDRLAEYTLNYRNSFGDHNIDVLAGYTAQETETDRIYVTASGFQNDRIEEITAGGADPSNFSLNGVTGKDRWSLLSYLARVSYNFDNRYYLMGTFRTDGSSRFGPNNRWGNFPSVSAGWNVSGEDFYQDLFGSRTSLKLRASWGLTGNNNIGNYNFEQVMGNPGGVVLGNNAISTAIWSDDLKDQNLGWESTSQYNFGADLGLFNGRLSFILNYYDSRSFDLLFNQSLSAVSGATSVLTNLRNSKIRNRGFDFQVDSRLISRKDFNLNLSGNISFNKNKVLDMGGASTIFSIGAERSYITHITAAGQPVGMFYGLKVAGMVRESDMKNIAIDNANYNPTTKSFPEGYVLAGPPRSSYSTNPLRPGDLYFTDINGDGIINDNDKTVIGNPYPDFIYGFNISLNWRNLDFSASFNGTQGNDVLDGQDYYLFNMEASGNQYSVVNDRYRNEANPGNGWVYRASRGGTQSNSTRLSSFYLQDGSYFRCTNMMLGYTINGIDRLTNEAISGIRVYGGVNNLFTITNYLGYNPEVDYNNGANLTPGVDYGKYPLVRSFNLGAKISF
ncbi:SusC/RagA family TonB-linked outer membrane protein [Flavihumibacter solisilvae]|uniref:SusC/RagA family TonB-linked outer membrane protein n=1 Tax=Flavihumibacter solisilvae TaxID=1349421 RepID=UPI000907C4D3|nr:TonB-dependent receptor [Flavihumibacter solisilvae]